VAPVRPGPGRAEEIAAVLAGRVNGASPSPDDIIAGLTEAIEVRLRSG
jgi:hypothetical protein